MRTDPAGGLLVIGIGSDLHGDDAAGRIVADRIDDLQGDGILVRSVIQLVPELVEDLVNCSLVVFVDADLECTAMIVRPLEAAAVGKSVTHHLTPAGLLRLAVTVGVTPPPAVLIGIPVRRLVLGSGLSAQAKAGIEAAVGAIMELAETQA
jgi:hydrogenase maturation protease